MSIRFAIKSTASKAVREGDTIVRFSGAAEPFRRMSERHAVKRGVDTAGNPTFLFTTGLDEKKVDFYSWYNDEEKKEVKKQIKELKPIISNFYGEDAIIETNKYFWLEDRTVNKLALTNEDVDMFFDTKNPTAALLYLSIISGAFIDLVAPTKAWADGHPDILHYLVLEQEDTYDDEDDITRADAYGALAELRKDASTESLFILAWCLQYDTNAFGAYLKSTPQKDLINYHMKYIDGKIVTKKKRNMPVQFMEYAEKWKGQQTRPKLYVEAYVKAGEYYSYITQQEKKYVTIDGTVLGNTISDAVETLMKPKFTQDLENLRQRVEAKWKE